MTTTLTPKENYLRLAKGAPQSVPFFNMGMPMRAGEMTTAMIGPSIFMPTHMGRKAAKIHGVYLM